MDIFELWRTHLDIPWMISVVVDDFSSFDDERCFTAEHVFKKRILNS
jgi:hypothetical protein